MHTIAKYGPEPDSIYFFSDYITDDGAFSVNGDPESRCREALETTVPFLMVSRIEPLLSTYERDARDIVPSIYSHVKVIGVTQTGIKTQISSSWTGLWDGAIDASMNTALGPFSDYWTGTNIDGTLYSENCSNWSDNTISAGATGLETSNTSSWINSVDSPCNNSFSLICVGY